MKKKLIIGNWKSNPASLKEAVWLAKKIERGLMNIEISKYRNVRGEHGRTIELVIAPPFPFLLSVGRVLKSSKLGAQNVFWGNTGPYTGEVSWRQLKHLGISYVIVGHSERKFYLGETDEMINKKVRSSLQGGLSVVLCIGERERSGSDIPPVVGEQLKNALLGVKKTYLRNLIVAYEPVWAISTNPDARADTPDNAFRASVYIRKTIAGLYGRKAAELTRIIYGGSVTSKNIAVFLSEGKMEGALVGGASLDPGEFVKIVQVASRGH